MGRGSNRESLSDEVGLEQLAQCYLFHLQRADKVACL